VNPLLVRAAASLLLNRHGRARPLVVGLLVLGLIASLAVPAAVVATVGLAVVGLTGSPSTIAASGVDCLPAGGGLQASTASLSSASSSASLDPVQLGHAQEIVRAGEQRRVPSYGVVVALAVALTESRLRMLANDGKGSDLRPEQRGVSASLEYPHDGVGSDHGSVNAFQQQWPAWGSMDELMSMDVSAGKFYSALLQVPGWQELPLTVAAQRVQRSAFPDAYAPWEPLARTLFARFAGAGNSCLGPGHGLTCPPTGLAAEDGMTPDALRVLRCAHQQFPAVKDWIGNYLPSGPSDHANGRAVDVMIPNWQTASGTAYGWTLATWVRRHAAQLGVRYVIFHDHIWSVLRNAEGWRTYRNPEVAAAGDGTPSQRHLNHVHVSVLGNAAGETGPAEVTLPVGGLYRLGAGFSACGQTVVDCHTGLDFLVPKGTDVVAAAKGRVTFVGRGGQYGLLTRVSHGGGVQTWYAHLSRQIAAVGEKVTVGQVIGLSGSGSGTGPALHFEVRAGGTPTDPAVWLQAHGLDP
jgi:Peptidase family M23